MSSFSIYFKNKKFYLDSNIRKFIYLSGKNTTLDLLLFSACANNKRKNFDIRLDIEMPPFYQKVLNIVNKIPYGRYLSYQEVASKAGNPKATRATGSANARNPIPVIIPCHRVLASGGNLGGYGGGIKIKKYLLKLEGIQ